MGGQYGIRTLKLSYKLSGQVDGFNWSCWNKRPEANRYILIDVNCEARPGEIMAIAGPSGAGKTTLLEILAGMIPQSRVSGYVLVNERPVNAKQFRKVSGYVAQGNEALFPLLTVEETLMYSARLRLHGGFNMAKTRVIELMNELELDHVANSRIGGDSSRGISGGEKLRVSIGVDLVHDPSVLLVDEPTSGLDSASALNVALLLKSMSMKQGKTIVLTIHQPGYRILELFDQVLLLSNGTVLHHGSLNLLENRLRFSGQVIPQHVNVLEFAIEVAQALVTDAKESQIQSFIDEEFTNVKANPEASYCNPPIKEVIILIQRFSKNIFRTKQLFAARIFLSALASFVLGTLFMNTSNDPSKFKLHTQMGFFAISLAFLLSSTTEGLPFFLQERKILMRETTKAAYRISSHVISNTLVSLPLFLIVALVFATPVYWLVGLRRDMGEFLYFSLVVWLVILMSNSFVACFGAFVPNFIIGNSLISGFMGSFFIFSGYFIKKDDIPKYWIFMHYLSLFKYPFECFVINEYGGEKGKRKCLKTIEGVCYQYADGFMKQQGLKDSQKWSNLSVMLGFIIGYRFLCFCILWYRSYRSQC